MHRKQAPTFLFYINILFVIFVSIVIFLSPTHWKQDTKSEYKACQRVPIIDLEKDIYLVVIGDFQHKYIKELVYVVVRSAPTHLYIFKIDTQYWISGEGAEAVQIKYMPREYVFPCGVVQKMVSVGGVPLSGYVVFDTNSHTLYWNGRGSVDVWRRLQQKSVPIDTEIIQADRYINLEDGSRGILLTFADFNKYLGRYLEIPSIKNESVTVEIYNSTAISGYAKNWARLFKNLGYNVVRIGNVRLEEKDKGNAGVYVYVSPAVVETESAKLILKLLDTTKFTTRRFKTFINTADIVIILAD